MSDNYIVRKEPCPKCRAKGEDSSGDNLIVYSDGGKFCFACNSTIELSDTYKEKYKIKEREEIIYPMTNFTREDWDKFKEQLGTNPKGFRGLKKSVCDAYMVHHEYSPTTGDVVKQIYPISKGYDFSGYKFRTAPEKGFGAEGTNKKDCDLFGQAMFQDSTSKKIVIAQGELDALSAYQMLNENTKEGYDPIPVVSGTVGEKGSIKQYQNNYEFLNKFEQIIFIPDNDVTGQEALHEVAKVLPKNKLHILDLPLKDCNEMLEAKESDRFRTMFWLKTRHYSPAGILGSDVLYEMMLEKAKLPKIKFPSFLNGLNRATAGGITQGSIINITAGSGCLPSTTEYLTPDGWKYIDQYKEGDVILQYDKKTNKCEYTEPKEFLKEPCDEFYKINLRNGSFTSSLYHTNFLFNVKTREYVSLTTETLLTYLNTQLEDLLFVKEISYLNKDGYKRQYNANDRFNSHFQEVGIEPINNNDKFMYCFNTTTGYFIIRQNGRVCITGNSGKTTLVNQIILDFALENKVKVGVVSLEADGGDYCENLVGCHMKRKLQLFETPEEKVAFLESDEARAAGKEVLLTDEGTPRFYVIDDRGDYDNLKDRIEELIISCGCNFIVIDVLSDVFDGENIDFQAKWMSWEKATVKMYGVTIVNIMHTRKGGSGQRTASQGAVLSEEDIAGSSASYKSASLNIILSRDKTAEDEEIRNMVQVHLAKNRQTGWTGVACTLFYDGATHRLQDATDRFIQIQEETIKQGIGNNEKPINRFGT